MRNACRCGLVLYLRRLSALTQASHRHLFIINARPLVTMCPPLLQHQSQANPAARNLQTDSPCQLHLFTEEEDLKRETERGVFTLNSAVGCARLSFVLKSLLSGTQKPIQEEALNVCSMWLVLASIRTKQLCMFWGTGGL